MKTNKKAFRVTTKVGSKQFSIKFKTVKGVDKYLKGAIKLKKDYPKAQKPTFFVNGTKVTKRY